MQCIEQPTPAEQRERLWLMPCIGIGIGVVFPAISNTGSGSTPPDNSVTVGGDPVVVGGDPVVITP